MSTQTIETTTELVNELLAMPAAERAFAVDKLLESLHQPDPEIEAHLLAEVEDRLAAFDRGEIKEITEEEFFADDDA